MTDPQSDNVPASSPPSQTGKAAKGRAMFDLSSLLIVVISLACAAIVYLRDGQARVWSVLTHDSWIFVEILPRILAGSLIGGFIAYVIPRERVSKTLGSESGWMGLLIGMVFGALLPGGPFTIYPVASALLVAGADAGAIISFVTSWTLIGYARALVWEMPFMGPDFTFWRILICLPLPILAGWLGRTLMRVVPAFAVTK